MRWLAAAIGLFALAAAAPTTRWTITDPGQGPVLLPSGGTAASTLARAILPLCGSTAIDSVNKAGTLSDTA